MDNEATTIPKSKKISKKYDLYSSNFVHYIFDREAGYDRNTRLLHSRNPPENLQYELPMFKCFPPNFTIQNVDKPLGFMRKFTPNGKLLLSFSQDQRSLDIYAYRGIGAMADLLQNQEKEYVTASDDSDLSLLIRQAAFQRFFVLKRSIRFANVGIPGGYLSREFSIFLEDGRYVLIASMGLSVDLPPVEHIFEYPDIFHDTDLFFYNFYLVNLEDERISNFFSYKYDSIQLSHNHGVSVCGPTMAVYSKYRQVIDLFEISNGEIIWTYTVGTSESYIGEQNIIFPIDRTAVYTMPLTHLKQRILTYIFRMYERLEDVNVRRQKLREFYRDFPKYERMIISKMQLVGRHNLLIRYEQHPNNSDAFDANPLKLYVFYCITTQNILKLYFQNSSELLYLLRDYCDLFRNVYSLQTGRPPSSSSNNIYLLGSFNDTVAMIPDVPHRLNPTLPISTQSYTPSPYLDCNLFLYDDRQISALERPRINLMNSLCFRDRDTERPVFRLYLESTADESHNQIEDRDPSLLFRRDLVAFIFHPFEPFVISLQKSQRYIVNFHVYNTATVVRE